MRIAGRAARRQNPGAPADRRTLIAAALRFRPGHVWMTGSADLDRIAAAIAARAGDAPRLMVAIAGPPGAGKSTTAAQLCEALPAGSAAVVPMDGFHFDDVVLHQRGQRRRKGAPETFDVCGFAVLLRRLRDAEPEVAIPVFDRSLELSRAGAAIVAREVRFVLVEGNYLLLDEAPWSSLAGLFDLTVFIDVPRAELERRLVERWRFHGRDDDDARLWIASNDMPNIDRVLACSRPADLVIAHAAIRVPDGMAGSDA